MQRSRTAALVLVAASLLAGPASAWDRTGHLVVARIAWEQMSPGARAAANELLVAAPQDSDLHQLRSEGMPLEQRQRRHFQLAAYWPDLVRDGGFPERREKYHHGDWHWINHFFEKSGADGESRELTDLEPQGLIVERLGALVPMLADDSLPAAERSIYLAWVLHLGGDVHQPLHATARVTETEPLGDRGGNLFELDGRNNLHSFWDGILRSSNTRWFFQSEDAYVANIARSIMTEHRPGAFEDRLRDREFASWARESFELSLAEAYALERGHKPPSSYKDRAVELARERVALAGYRLAALLEDVLGTER